MSILNAFKLRYDGSHAAKDSAEYKRDPYGTGWLQTWANVGEKRTLRVGMVMDSVPGAHCYLVCAGAESFWWCTALVQGSLGPFGPKPLAGITLGNVVHFIDHPQYAGYGLIVGVSPPWTSDASFWPADRLWPFDRAGVNADAAHAARMGLAGSNGGVVDWNASRPLDMTGAGEFGAIAETGVAISMDSFHAQVRVDEATGLFVFYHDQLTRVAGINLQVRHGYGEAEALDDCGESHIVKGTCVYPWEAVGVYLVPGVSPATATTYVDVGDARYGTAKGRYEPATFDQTPFYRKTEFDGYLGQGGRTVVSVPGSFLLENVVKTRSNGAGTPAVFDESTALDGGHYIRSAKEIVLAKRLNMPTPHQVRRPEDLNGDEPVVNYAPNGFGAPAFFDGNGLNPAFNEDTTEPDSGYRVNRLWDVLGMVFNWKIDHPFHLHANDWYVSPDTGVTGSANNGPVGYSALTAAHMMPLPPAVNLVVDHRQVANYFRSSSHIALADDGSIVLSDGYGAEIVLSGGNITLRCPGDVNVMPGRSFVTWAGWDAVVKARNCADVTASFGDVRVKAENNLMMLAGNNRCGGVLIESRAACPIYDYSTPGVATKTSGVVIQARTSQVVMRGHDVVVQANVDGQTNGHIHVDAGTGVFRLECSYLARFVSHAAYDFFGTVDDLPASVNEYTSAVTTFGSDLRVYGDEAVSGVLHVRDNVFVPGGHVFTGQADSFGNKVTRLRGTGQQQSMAEIDETETRVDELVSEISVGYAESPSAPAGLDDVNFCLRVSTDYAPTDYQLYEAPWQAQWRLGGSTVPSTWSEPAVSTAAVGGDAAYTQPHPGRRAWSGDGQGSTVRRYYKQPTATFVDPTTGMYIPGTPAYSRTIQASVPTQYENEYVITIY